MKIGIAAPISVNAFWKYLDLSEEEKLLGMGAPSVDNLVNGLLEKGHSVAVYTLDMRVDQLKILKGDRLTIYLGHYRPVGRHRSLSFFSKERKQIKEFIRKDQPDIVNAHWTYEYAWAAIDSGYYHLISFNDHAGEILKFRKDYYRFLRFLMDALVRRKGQNFNVNSPYLQQKLGQLGKALPVIANPIEENLILDRAKKVNGKGVVKLISILNGWSVRKNGDTAIAAFALLRRKWGAKVELHMFGDGFGPHEGGEQWAKSNNWTQGIYFHGEVPHQKLMNQLDDFDILIHPSREESFGNVLIEAMARGLPVIGGENSGAVPYVLNYGKNGILVDINSKKAIAGAVEKLITDADLYTNFSNDGLAYVRNFSKSKIADQYLELYRNILLESKFN
ncbi:glycosyltransferase family 4 protein [Xanthovirga aplysinae]|uniref:glycosyltransferase family 4 protein n=1 Tax=Xanthovirga aplysinae TaxID=2529853 RepID=UPI0012BB6E12|nr:glycosyltransferase family 4 protein [Xanthovirga aplysinae]MTI29573.1 glycosyltransferase [Xanthovirga aplysinae]